MEILKEELGSRGYEKLVDLVKNKTSFSNLNKDNIEETKVAISMLFSWLESIYNIDRKNIEMDNDGMDIRNLFKITGNS